MTILSMEIAGYRGFIASQTVNFAVPNGKLGSGLTIITGANNSGKSTILECLRARNGHQSPVFSDDVINSNTDYISIKYTFKRHAGEDDSNSTLIEEVKSVRKGASQSVRTGYDASDKTRQICLVPSRRSFEPFFHGTPGSRHSYIANSGLPPLRMPSLTNFYERLLEIEAGDPGPFNELLSEVLGFKPSWSVRMGGTGASFVRIDNRGHVHSTDGLGEGVVGLFALIDALRDMPKDGTVVVDEPELSLHPALQRRLAKLLSRLASEHQIIYATHSPYFVDLPSVVNGAELVRVVATNNGTVAYQISQVARDALSESKPDRSFPHLFGIEAREALFHEDCLILVEGQEDVFLYPTVLKELDISLPGHFFGWGSHGADRMERLCRVLSGMGYQKVVGILDANKRDVCDRLRESFPQFHFDVIPADDVRDKNATEGCAIKEGLLDGDNKLRDKYRVALLATFDGVTSYFGKNP
jgi:predicted ATPase